MLIGITGRAGSGKDTAADVLCKDFNFVNISLADPLKRFLAETFEFSTEQLWGPSENRNVPDARWPRPSGDVFLTPRHALQQLGTEFGRSCSNLVWVKYLLRVYEKLCTGNYYYDPVQGLRHFVGNSWARGKQDVVVSDVRYRSEAACIRGAGGLIWRVRRAAAPTLPVEQSVHSSETEQDTIEVDAALSNDGTVEDLVRLVHAQMGDNDGMARCIGG
jgi:hypothetical protein